MSHHFGMAATTRAAHCSNAQPRATVIRLAANFQEATVYSTSPLFGKNNRETTHITRAAVHNDVTLLAKATVWNSRHQYAISSAHSSYLYCFKKRDIGTWLYFHFFATYVQHEPRSIFHKYVYIRYPSHAAH